MQTRARVFFASLALMLAAGAQSVAAQTADPLPDGCMLYCTTGMLGSGCTDSGPANCAAWMAGCIGSACVF
jgi:hypothetical protein